MIIIRQSKEIYFCGYSIPGCEPIIVLCILPGESSGFLPRCSRENQEMRILNMIQGCNLEERKKKSVYHESIIISVK